MPHTIPIVAIVSFPVLRPAMDVAIDANIAAIQIQNFLLVNFVLIQIPPSVLTFLPVI